MPKTNRKVHNMRNRQYTFQDVDDNTGFGLSWYQGNTGNAIFNDTLTAFPVVDMEAPRTLEKHKEKVMIYIAPEMAALAFYVLMQVGEVKCIDGNIFEIDVEFLDFLHNRSIAYEVVQ